MTTLSLMVQGTASHVGKSAITAALCRIFKEDGLKVAPFKAQNMALNSFVTEEGLEMGRAQVFQAEAAGVRPTIEMNPILLKPDSDTGSQIIIDGKVFAHMNAKEYHAFKGKAAKFVEAAYRRLTEDFDMVVIEGAGSPAEINLRKNDIANMGTAHMTDSPVILVGDIDRGGVFASIVGTLTLLSTKDRARVKAVIINKFRGDLSLLEPGIREIEKLTGLPVLGVIPYFRDIYLQEEDSLGLLGHKASGNGVDVAVIELPHISNFTDFDALKASPEVRLRYVKANEKIGRADIIIIPGTKNTLADLDYLMASSYDEEIRAHIKEGRQVIGICGGFQMLGISITDDDVTRKALGLLDIETTMAKEKTTHQVVALSKTFGDKAVTGYEIHMGETTYLNNTEALFKVTRAGSTHSIKDGAISKDKLVFGSYIHGLFDNDELRKKIFSLSGETTSYSDLKEEGYKKLAELVRSKIDMNLLYEIIERKESKLKVATA